MRKKFTLIELLIIIAIIAILAGMLLPVLNKARDRSKAIKCTANLRTFGSSNALYAQDYNDYCVPGHLPGIFWSINSTYRRLLGATAGTTSFVEADDWTVAPGLVCPSEIRPPRLRNNYGMNFQPFISGDLSYDCMVFKLTKIKHPSARYLFLESRNWQTYRNVGSDIYAAPFSNAGYWNKLNIPQTQSDSAVAYRHGNLQYANVNFFDGHVKMMRWNEVYIPSGPEAYRKWNAYR